MIKDIAFVGYPTTDMKKARAFYEGLLGLVPTNEFGPVTDESEFIEYAVGSGTLSIGKMDNWKPSSDGPSAAFEVDDFDDVIKKLKDNNIVFVIDPMDTPVCHMAVVQDYDGNGLMIHQRKQS